MTDARPDAPRRVLIADDHPLYCDALRVVVLQACPGAEVSEAGTQQAVLDAVGGPDRFDLVVLDLNLPGASGLSCLTALRRAAPGTPVVVVSAVDDPRIMQDVILGGANAYVPKSAPPLARPAAVITVPLKKPCSCKSPGTGTSW